MMIFAYQRKFYAEYLKLNFVFLKHKHDMDFETDLQLIFHLYKIFKIHGCLNVTLVSNQTENITFFSL